MRLLNATTYEVREFRQRSLRPQYAILSHRWVPQDITFETLSPVEFQDGDLVTPQLAKIRNTCRRAREDKLEWVWIDLCCINKDSSEELNRSINDMFKWYQEVAVCYTYSSEELNHTPSWFVLSAFLPPFLGPFIWDRVRRYRHKRRQEWALTLNSGSVSLKRSKYSYAAIRRVMGFGEDVAVII